MTTRTTTRRRKTSGTGIAGAWADIAEESAPSPPTTLATSARVRRRQNRPVSLRRVAVERAARWRSLCPPHQLEQCKRGQTHSVRRLCLAAGRQESERGRGGNAHHQEGSRRLASEVGDHKETRGEGRGGGGARISLSLSLCVYVIL